MTGTLAPELASASYLAFAKFCESSSFRLWNTVLDIDLTLHVLSGARFWISLGSPSPCFACSFQFV